jgi:cytidine deaminase
MDPEDALRQIGDPVLRHLAEVAVAASQHAYADYSKFKVGAAVLTKEGKVYRGCNVENDSYGLTSCAERNAVFAAVAEEGDKMRIVSVAVYAVADTVPPCGACRQVLAQFGRNATLVYPKNGSFTITSVGRLLPVGFQLEKKR